MIKISELKEGDLVMVDFEGTLMEGEVLEVNNGQKLAQILTNGQNEFWYAGDVLNPIPLSDAALQKINFLLLLLQILLLCREADNQFL